MARNYGYPGGSIPFGMMTTGSTTFSCGHSETSTVPYTPATASGYAMRCDGPCSRLGCRKKFANRMMSELQLSGMHCEHSLRQFNMVEPMLPEELTAAGCSGDLLTALLNCHRHTPATSAYLGHRKVLSNVLPKYEASLANGSQQETAVLGMELLCAVNSIQRKLTALQAVVARFRHQKSFPAPAMPFSMKEGVDTFEQTWGVKELAALKSSPEGRAILDRPCSDPNILSAKSTIMRSQSELAHLQATERAAFFADYPGTEALRASGAMKSSQEMIDAMAVDGDLTQNFADMKIDGMEEIIIYLDVDTDEMSCDGPCDVARHKCKHAAECQGIDMDKVREYSGKSYDALTNPWWYDL